MGSFDYSEKSWKKIQPLTLKKTGLTEALKTWESAVATLRKEEFFPDIFNSLLKAEAALEAVEKARSTAIKLCGKSHTECVKALETAVPGSQTKLIQNIALTALNKQVLVGVEVINNFKVFNLDTRAKQAKIAADTLQKLLDMSDEGFWGLRGDKGMSKILNSVEPFCDEGDNKYKSPISSMGASYPALILKKSVLASRFPSVVADLTKLEQASKVFEELSVAYNVAARDIKPNYNKVMDRYKKLQVMHEKKK